MKGNLKRTTGNLLSPLGAKSKDIGAASQTLLTGVKSRLRRRIIISRIPDSLSSIPDFKFQDSGFPEAKITQIPSHGANS